MDSKSAQIQTLTNTVSILRAAEALLLQASRATTDLPMLLQINAEYNNLDSWISQLLHTQAVDDDTQFSGAIASLKQQANLLSADEAHIQVIVKDVATAGKIVGYITQAVAFLGAL